MAEAAVTFLKDFQVVIRRFRVPHREKLVE
jgi:hypothetical protein